MMPVTSTVRLECRPDVGPSESVLLPINAPEWVWGRGVTRPGRHVAPGYTIPELSRRAVAVSHAGRKVNDVVVETGVMLATDQGSRHSTGGLDVYDDSGTLLHRLTGATQPRLRLYPGRYRLVVRILDPVCEIDLDFERSTTPSVRVPDPEHTRSAWEPAAIFATARDGETGPLAVALIAAACVHVPELRGGRTVSDTFDAAVKALIGRSADWSREMFKQRCEQQGIEVPQGSARLSYVATHARQLLTASQLDDLAELIATSMGEPGPGT